MKQGSEGWLVKVDRSLRAIPRHEFCGAMESNYCSREGCIRMRDSCCPTNITDRGFFHFLHDKSIIAVEVYSIVVTRGIPIHDQASIDLHSNFLAVLRIDLK